jgi:hypothetical protein
MQIPKEMEGRYASLLMEGISVQEVKILKIVEGELVCKYHDDEEVHIDQNFLRAWWPDKKRNMQSERAKVHGFKRKPGAEIKASKSNDLHKDETNTQDEE